MASSPPLPRGSEDSAVAGARACPPPPQPLISRPAAPTAAAQPEPVRSRCLQILARGAAAAVASPMQPAASGPSWIYESEQLRVDEAVLPLTATVCAALSPPNGRRTLHKTHAFGQPAFDQTCCTECLSEWAACWAHHQVAFI